MLYSVFPRTSNRTGTVLM